MIKRSFIFTILLGFMLLTSICQVTPILAAEPDDWAEENDYFGSAVSLSTPRHYPNFRQSDDDWFRIDVGGYETLNIEIYRDMVYGLTWEFFYSNYSTVNNIVNPYTNNGLITASWTNDLTSMQTIYIRVYGSNQSIFYDLRYSFGKSGPDDRFDSTGSSGDFAMSAAMLPLGTSSEGKWDSLIQRDMDVYLFLVKQWQGANITVYCDGGSGLKLTWMKDTTNTTELQWDSGVEDGKLNLYIPSPNERNQGSEDQSEQYAFIFAVYGPNDGTYYSISIRIYNNTKSSGGSSNNQSLFRVPGYSVEILLLSSTFMIITIVILIRKKEHKPRSI